jgi:hypothetical protein
MIQSGDLADFLMPLTERDYCIWLFDFLSHFSGKAGARFFGKYSI